MTTPADSISPSIDHTPITQPVGQGKGTSSKTSLLETPPRFESRLSSDPSPPEAPITDDQANGLGIGQLAASAAYAGGAYVFSIGKAIVGGIGEHLWYGGKGALNLPIHIYNDLKEFAATTKREWDEAKGATATAGMVALKALEILTKPITKLVEYPAYAVFGLLGGLINAKEGKEWGQKLAKRIGEELWKGACFIGRGVQGMAVGAVKRLYYGGVGVINLPQHIKNDLEKFVTNTKEEWGAVKDKEATAKAGVVALKALEILTKPFTKLVEYPAYAVFGLLGGLINAKEGKEWGQKLAKRIGEGLWSGACFIGRGVQGMAVGVAKRLYYGGVGAINLPEHIKNDLKEFVTNTKEEWGAVKDKGATATAGMVALKALEILTKPITKLVEYPAYAVFGLLGGLINAKEGKEWGQKLAKRIGEELWKGACFIGRGVQGMAVGAVKRLYYGGVGVINLPQHIKNDLEKFVTNTKEEWGAVKDKEATAKAGVVALKALEILTKPFTKLVEYPAYAVFGLLGGLINAKAGKEWGQKLAKRIGEGLWSGACFIGRGVQGMAVGVAKRLYYGGVGVINLPQHIKNDLEKFVTNTKEEWGAVKDKGATATAGMVALKALEILTKPITKLVEYPAYAVFGTLGGLINAKAGKEWGQKLAKRIGEELWKGACFIGRGVQGMAVGAVKRLYYGGVGVINLPQHIKNDLEKFVTNTKEEWGAVKAKGATATAGVVALKALEILTKPITKLVEYPAYAVFGLLGGLINAKAGKEWGQKLAKRIGEELWKGACFIGRGVQGMAVGAAKRLYYGGVGAINLPKHIKNDLEKFVENTKKKWGEAQGAPAKAGVVALKALEILIKPFTKLVEYPAYAVFGLLGGLINAEEGKEWGQQLAKDIGENLWKGSCFIGRGVQDVAVGVAKRLYYGGVGAINLPKHIKNDLEKFVRNTKKEWGEAQGATATAGVVALKALEILIKPFTKLVEYPAYAVFGLLGGLINAEEGKKWGQDLAKEIGEKLWDGACYIGRPIKKRAAATASLVGDAITGTFSDIAKAKTHFTELKAEIKASSGVKGFGIACLEVLSWPATIVFIVTKFAFCGSLGLVGALLAGKEAKDTGILFGKVLAYAPHSIATFIPNTLSKGLMNEIGPDGKKVDRKLSIVKTRNAELLAAKKAAIAYINKSKRGNSFLKKYCGLNLPPPSDNLKKEISETAKALVAA